MKMTKIAMLILAIAAALYILIPGLSWAEEGVLLHRAKYGAWHGPDGAGKSAAKIPDLVR